MYILKVLFFAFLLSGCISDPNRPISISKIQYETLPPKSADFPITVIDRTEISRPYRVIGVVQAKTRDNPSKEIIEQFKIESRKLGGDALIDLQHQATGTIEPPPDMHGHREREVLRAKESLYSGELWTAKVIVWQNP